MVIVIITILKPLAVIVDPKIRGPRSFGAKDSYSIGIEIANASRWKIRRFPGNAMRARRHLTVLAKCGTTPVGTVKPSESPRRVSERSERAPTPGRGFRPVSASDGKLQLAGGGDEAECRTRIILVW